LKKDFNVLKIPLLLENKFFGMFVLARRLTRSGRTFGPVDLELEGILSFFV
jgi:hypothetical protein